MFRYGTTIFILLECLLAALPAQALPKEAIELGPFDLFQAFANGKVITCGRISFEWRSGTMVGKNKTHFLSRKDKIKIIKKKMKSAEGIKLAKLKKQKKKFAGLRKSEDPICTQNGGGGYGPSPTPSPGAGNFDAFGNVTATGKANFEIPSSLSANVDTGKSVYQTNCIGCHSEQLNRTFGAIRQAFASVPQMGFALSLSDAQVANITAYLNRFNQ